jgi:nitrogenase molybdenum-iron protein alpha/beta subunit
MSSNFNGIRESRPYTFNDCGGNSKELSGKFTKRCFKMADRSFSQGVQCQQINSMSALMSMEDSVFIVHSPQGCIGCTSMANDLYRVGQAHRGVHPVKNVRIIVTNLDEKDIIHGGEEKLRDAILLADERYHPKLIFVFTSCASGFDTAFISIAKYILDGIKVPVEKGLINLFAPTSVSYKDQITIEQMLAVLGLHVNYIPFYSSLEKIREIPVAEASTAICKVFADEFMKMLEENYGIPFSHTVMPIGVRNTDKWFRGVAALFGKDREAEQHIEKEHQRVLPQIADIRRCLEGKKVFICGGTGHSFAAAALIDDFGMKLIGLETPTYDDDAQIDIEYLNGIHGEYVVDIANMQPLGGVNDRLVFNRTYAGYRGSLTFVEDLYDNL